MASLEKLQQELERVLGSDLRDLKAEFGQIVVEVSPESLLDVCKRLRDEPALGFSQLIDVCGVDYLAYGQSEWETEDSSTFGFSRGVAAHSSGYLGNNNSLELDHEISGNRRFAAVYQLLSVANNHRLTLKTFAENDVFPVVPSVISIWASANWFEREAFDLFGIVFEGHPDLRRILTDYGFVGHPFRKDFPLIGNVEMRYDESKRRVVYEPVTIEPRVTVPRVVREDNRYGPTSYENEEAANG